MVVSAYLLALCIGGGCERHSWRFAEARGFRSADLARGKVGCACDGSSLCKWQTVPESWAGRVDNLNKNMTHGYSWYVMFTFVTGLDEYIIATHHKM